ncbi:MAG: prepilin-type N-terminal cleavage/methylation domain-containing protein [Gallionellaceae bacterium]|jgi:prepilin-type N-terminal cleavage/methylation domain-containing protein
MKNNQSGFTLIEIAIVLVIIGLLLGGVLKGQELINSAKVKNMATDFRNIPVYIYGYQDKFRSLPGDDPTIGTANTHLTGATQCTGAPTIVLGKCNVANGVIDGNWNDITAASESFVFWQHIRLAGLAAGSTNTALGAAYLPVNSAGGMIGLQSGTSCTAASATCTGALTPITDSTVTAIRGAYIICSAGILGKFAKQLDIQMDDGITNSGSMMAGIATAAGTPMTAATPPLDDATAYTVCMGI